MGYSPNWLFFILLIINYLTKIVFKRFVSFFRYSKLIIRLFRVSVQTLGNAAEAMIYLDNMTHVKNTSKHKELRDYLEKHQHEIIDYGLRQSVGKTIGSGRCEKGNDLVVAHRQKKKGMSWSRAGSSALAIVKTDMINEKLAEIIKINMLNKKLAPVA